MHSGTDLLRAVLASAGALACAASCGNYSNDDIVFTEALPVVGSVQVVLPTPTGQPLCAIASSDLDTNAQSTAAGLNQGINGILELISFVRTLPPSERTPEHRSWGPWPDQDHPGLESQVAMDRTGNQSFLFTLDQRRIGTSVWSTLLTADFEGAQPTHGKGYLIIHFDVSWTLGTAKPTDPHGDMTISYDFTVDPQYVGVQLGNAGLGLLGATYSFYRSADGGGQFTFAANDGQGNREDVVANFISSGAGRAVAVGHFGAIGVNFSECWDSAACVSYVSDMYGLSSICGQGVPCDKGDIASCPP